MTDATVDRHHRSIIEEPGDPASEDDVQGEIPALREEFEIANPCRCPV
jgi:hypothetical protein